MKVVIPVEETVDNSAMGGGGSRFLRVENLTAAFVTLLHPSLENNLHVTLQPRQIRLMSKEFMENPDNQVMADKGIITWEFADSLGKGDGRDEALGPKYAIENPALEYLVQQILLFPGDNLDMRDAGGIKPGTGVPNVPAMANVVYELITAVPKREPDKRVDVEYLKITHLPMLENALVREKLWRNRTKIVELLERRVMELKGMDSSGGKGLLSDVGAIKY